MDRAGDRKQLVLGTVLLGIGLMAAVDEVVFHQLLQWRHFYDRSTPKIALFSDGLLHAAEIVILVAGFFVFRDVQSRGPVDPTLAWGGFQIWDGLVDHKVLRVHQVRYGVDLLPYDIAWNGFGLLLLVAGLALLWRAREREPTQAARAR